jgi:hypothetical protein
VGEVEEELMLYLFQQEHLVAVVVQHLQGEVEVVEQDISPRFHWAAVVQVQLHKVIQEVLG